MPIKEATLGLTNLWYEDGLNKAADYTIDEKHTVKIFSAPYFIASKLEAFKSRGSNDGRTSSDFEDIIFVMDNRSTLWDEINKADQKVKLYLVAAFESLISNPYFEEWIMAHTGYGSPYAYPHHIFDGITGVITANTKAL